MNRNRIRASLLERAADRWQFAPAQPVPAEDGPEQGRPVTDTVPVNPSADYQPGAAGVVADAGPGHATAPIRRSPTRFAAVDRDLLADTGMLVPGGAVTPLAEEFRLVKRQVLSTSRRVEKRDPDAARMMLVCSGQPGDGKTFCAINLALSLAAERDLEVLLVDADFPKPDVLDRLGISSGLGLLDALADPNVAVEDYVVRTDIPQLSVLPAGTRSHADTELLSSDRARVVLDQLLRADSTRIILFDSPPALAASPASVLAAHVGQIVLVVRADRSTETDLRESVALLDGCDEIQLLLNAVTYRPGGKRFGSYYGREE